MKQSVLMEHVMKAGFPMDNQMLHLFVGGSQLHGAKIQGYNDLDIYGCYIEPPNRILGLQTMEHFFYSTGSDKVLNKADDVDITCYSLHRWGELMMKGNPTILHYLYADGVMDNYIWDTYIKPYREPLLSQKAAKQYLGFANSQRMRLTGEKGMGRHGQRPDLCEKYGYDTKFAMHYIRLLYECRELLRDRYITLPRPEKAHLIEIRTGKFTQDEVFAVGTELTKECDDLLANSTLREIPDVKEFSDIIGKAYRTTWMNQDCIKLARSFGPLINLEENEEV